MKISFILISFVVLFSIINSGYVKGDIPAYMLEGGPEWENYILDDEAIKDKLYCRTSEDEEGNIIETRWYNSFVNPNDVVRIDDGDTTTPHCEYPNYEPVYARGSNEGKVYSRKVFDAEGNVLETIWYDACSNEIIITEEGDTTYPGSNEFKEKCYHPDYITEDENGEVVVEEDVEEEVKDTPIVILWNNIFGWFKGLFNM